MKKCEIEYMAKTSWAKFVEEIKMTLSTLSLMGGSLLVFFAMIVAVIVIPAAIVAPIGAIAYVVDVKISDEIKVVVGFFTLVAMAVSAIIYCVHSFIKLYKEAKENCS